MNQRRGMGKTEGEEDEFMNIVFYDTVQFFQS